MPRAGFPTRRSTTSHRCRASCISAARRTIRPASCSWPCGSAAIGSTSRRMMRRDFPTGRPNIRPGRDQGRAGVCSGHAVSLRLGRTLGTDTVHSTVHSPRTAGRAGVCRGPSAVQAAGRLEGCVLQGLPRLLCSDCAARVTSKYSPSPHHQGCLSSVVAGSPRPAPLTG